MKAITVVKQKGLSLVETMIALTLGAIVTVGIIQLFVANSETYNLLQGQSRMQESARFALNFLSRNLQTAGYKGCYSRNNEVDKTMHPTAGIVPYEFDIRQGLRAYEGLGGVAGWAPTIDAIGLNTLPDSVNNDTFSGNAADGVPINNIIPGTDVLTIRRTSPTEHRLRQEVLTAADELIVEGEPEFANGDLALIHDCEKSTIFRVTSLITGVVGGVQQTTLGYSTAGAEPYDNDRERLPEENSYEAESDAAVSAIVTNIFYIAPGTGVNNQGNNPLSLWRKSGTSAPVELVEGIESLKLRFGEDTDNDGVPNVYSPPSGIADYGRVVTVRVSITVNSVDDVGADSRPTYGCTWDGGQQPCFDGEQRDGLIRRTFHETVQLRNKG